MSEDCKKDHDLSYSFFTVSEICNKEFKPFKYNLKKDLKDYFKDHKKIYDEYYQDLKKAELMAMEDPSFDFESVAASLRGRLAGNVSKLKKLYQSCFLVEQLLYLKKTYKLDFTGHIANTLAKKTYGRMLTMKNMQLFSTANRTHLQKSILHEREILKTNEGKEYKGKKIVLDEIKNCLRINDEYYMSFLRRKL